MLIASQYGMRSGQVQNQGGVGIAQSQSPQTQFTTDVSDTSSRTRSLSFSRPETANASGESGNTASGSTSGGSAQTTTAGSATRTSGGVKLGSIIDILV